MPIEQRPEITSFIRTWEGKPQPQVVEELASYALETKRIPDPYYFEISKNGELLSPVTHQRVKDVVKRTPPTGEMEYQTLLSIEQWVRDNNEGVIAWISPPYPGIYPTSKIIVSQIEKEGQEKRLSNTAIVLDFDENECLKLAQGLRGYCRNYSLITHPDILRANPLILNTHGIHWTYILGEFIDAPLVWEAIRCGDDKITKKEAIIQAQAIYPALFGGIPGPTDAKLMMLQILGDKPPSCPVLFEGSAFQIFSQGSLTLDGRLTSRDPDFCKNCPVCGEQINCIVKVGQSCPNCKAVKRCG